MAELSINEAVRGYSHTYRFDWNDLKTTGWLTSAQRVVGEFSAGGIIDTAVLYMVTAAGTATDITLDFGFTSADPDDLIDNADVDAMTKVVWNTGDAFIGSDSVANTTSNVLNGVVRNSTTPVDLIIEVNGTISSLTAGEWILAWNEKRVPTL